MRVIGAMDAEGRRQGEGDYQADDAASTIAPSEASSWSGSGEPAGVAATAQLYRVGSYRILRLLGEGGMGAVYEAEQEQPRRIVALKVIKPGLASSELLRRFEQESRALGRLHHPGIAQIYEAGTADTGFGPQPYFAMEFIQGPPLRDYADAQGLNVRQRLELMIKICDAVEHAHHRGLIHRDLKPGNILVDETGQPKIVDFGVSRATDSDARATRQTDLGQLVGTLAYMSPEQVLGDPLELDARSDVYALGVILYELLAGRLPYRVSPKLHEAVEAIRGEDPRRLSSFNGAYRGDVETIVAKALEKDKARRYASAADLAGDIRRYLEDRPIVARPPSASYQVRKFARRHKALVVGTAVVFVVLVGGIAASTWQAARATLERNRAVAEKQRADTEAATAKAVNEFLQNDLLAQAGASVQAGPGAKPDPDLKVRTALDRAASRIAGKFEQEPLVEASLRQTIGVTYLDLGLRAEAQREIERAVLLRLRVLGENHSDTLTSMSYLAELHRNAGNFGQAETLFNHILAARRRLLGIDHRDTFGSLDSLAATYIDEGKYASAGVVLTKAVEGRRRLLGEEHPSTLNSVHRMAAVHYRQGDYALTEVLLSKVLEVQRRTLGAEHPDTLQTADDLAIAFARRGKYREADRLLTDVLAVRRRVLGEQHPDTLLAMSDLGLLCRSEGKYAQAEPLLTKAVEGRRRVLGEEHPQTLSSINHLADLYRDQGRNLRASSLYTSVLKSRRRVLGADHPATLTTMSSLGRVRLHQGVYAEAESLLREALNGQERRGPDGWERYNSESMLGASLAGQGKFSEAEPLLQSGYQGLIQRKDMVPWDSRSALDEARERIVQLYQRWGKPAQAAEWKEKLHFRLAADPRKQ